MVHPRAGSSVPKEQYSKTTTPFFPNSLVWYQTWANKMYGSQIAMTKIGEPQKRRRNQTPKLPN